MELVLNAKELIRAEIYDMEEAIKSVDGHKIGDSDLCPLKHHFTDGVYTREIFIPKGTFLTGKIHKHAHPNFLMQGSVRVITENGGYEEITAPRFMISVAGTKRALLTLDDTIWITIHHNPSNSEDLVNLEKKIIAKDYKEFNKFVKIKEMKARLFGLLNIKKWKQIQ